MTLALYRKYRPRTFAEVIGQEHVTEPLMQALRSGRLNHAYLFSGPRGCGKTSSARILARSLNCAKGPTPEPCGECDSCVALAPDGAGSIDVIEIDAASHGGVDDARDLRERAFFAPVSSRFKVYVIDEAHMVSTQGFNALLKLVEEPPDYVKFIFATTEPEKVLGTIKSRTHHYPFRLMPPGVLRPYLEMLCEREGARVEPAVFPLVVRAGGGSARDSLSVMDQLIAGAGAEGVTYARAVALLGVTDVALIDEMCGALVAGDGGAAYATIDRVSEAGHDPRRFAADLLERLRDLIVLQQVPDAAEKGLLDGPADELSRMGLQAQQFGAATLSRMADIVHNGLTEMRGTTAPRLLLELVCARMLLPGADSSTGALLQRLERMERRLTAGNSAPDALPPPEVPDRRPRGSAPSGPEARPPADASPAAPAIVGPGPAAPATAGPGPAVDSERSPLAPDAVPTTAHPGTARPDTTRSPAAGPGATAPGATTPEAGATGPGGDARPSPGRPGTTPVGSTGTAGRSAPGVVDVAAIRNNWQQILGHIGKPRVAAVIRDAIVRAVEGDTLVLLFKHSFHASAATGDAPLIAAAVAEEFGGSWQIRCELSGQESGVPPTVAPPRPAASAGPASASVPAAAATAPVTTGPADTDDDNGWPTTARLGGPADQVAAPPDRPTRAASATQPAAQAGPRTGPADSGRSTARAAAARPRKTTRPPRQAAGAEEDAPPPDEPPYDPDYDPPVRDVKAGGYEGFDPGDEPLDDVPDEKTVRQSSEQQALQLLAQKLGAEKIGELGAR